MMNADLSEGDLLQRFWGFWRLLRIAGLSCFNMIADGPSSTHWSGDVPHARCDCTRVRAISSVRWPVPSKHAGVQADAPGDHRCDLEAARFVPGG